jgi:minor histocompatibility antigen H13
VRSQVNPVNAETKAFPKPYFFGGLLGYLFGIVLTVVVMYAFDSAQVSLCLSISLSLSVCLIRSQPALLYLVPACLLGTVLVGYWKQDLHHLWAYDEAKIYEEAKRELEQQSKGEIQSSQQLNSSEAESGSDSVEDKKER